MFCPNCRANVPDGTSFCTNCGYNLTAATAAPVAPASPAYGAAPAYGAPAHGLRHSTWDGSVFDTFINSLVASLIMTCTCGIATPWAMCYMLKFIVSHTIVDGKRYRFDGDGASLFGNWFVWALLTAVTCGIYSFWVTPKMYQWVVSHIHCED